MQKMSPKMLFITPDITDVHPDLPQTYRSRLSWESPIVIINILQYLGCILLIFTEEW